MSCPACDHTMECVVPDLFWCPRCGTIRARADEPGVANPLFLNQSPKLVERCREFAATATGSNLLSCWHRLGIAESINTPENRK